MKSIIASLFTIYSLTSGNRLLLQQFIPQPVAPAQPVLPGAPAQPVLPGAPAQPVLPGAPAQPVLPGTANPGAATPGTTAWVAPTLPIEPIYNPKMECLLPNTDPAGCAGRITQLENPAQNFVFKCGAVGACAAATLKFTYVNSFTERVEQIQFSEMFAGYGATIYMDSTQSATKQYIDKFECKAQGSCLNVNLKLFGGSSVNDVNCPYSNFCQNCNIYTCEWGTNGEELCGVPKACFKY